MLVMFWLENNNIIIKGKVGESCVCIWDQARFWSSLCALVSSAFSNCPFFLLAVS